jgi:hypothetical protein
MNNHRTRKSDLDPLGTEVLRLGEMLQESETDP